jgi:hypothetical protein
MLLQSLVGALMQHGDYSAAAFTMRLWDRMRGLMLPMLANVGAQAMYRAFDKTLTPHAWAIPWTPASMDEQMGGNCAVTQAVEAKRSSLKNSGCNDQALSGTGNNTGILGPAPTPATGNSSTSNNSSTTTNTNTNTSTTPAPAPAPAAATTGSGDLAHKVAAGCGGDVATSEQAARQATSAAAQVSTWHSQTRCR